MNSIDAKRVNETFFGLQILRFVAASFVGLTHLWASLRRNLHYSGVSGVLGNGVLGVDIFFCISGFVIYLSAEKLRRHAPTGWQRARIFFSRRFFRVAPSYYLLTLTKLAIFLVVPSAITFFHPHAWNTLASFLFLTRVHGGDFSSPVLAVGWTLCYEMLFYGVVALLLWTTNDLLKPLTITIGSMALLGWFIQGRQGILPFLLNPIELEFLGGVAIAASLPYLRRLPTLMSVFLFFLGLWYGLLTPHVGTAANIADFHVRFFSVSGFLIVLSVLALERRIDFSRYRTFLLLGDASYALYLTHEFVLPPITSFVARVFSATIYGVAAAGGTVMALCYGAALLYHLKIEDPITRMFLAGLPWSLRSSSRKSNV